MAGLGINEILGLLLIFLVILFLPGFLIRRKRNKLKTLPAEPKQDR